MFGFRKNKIIVNYHASNKMVEYNFIKGNLHFYYYYVINLYKFCRIKEYTWRDCIDMNNTTIATFIISEKNNLYHIRHGITTLGLFTETHEPSYEMQLSIYIYDMLYNKILHKLLIYYPHNEHHYLPTSNEFGTKTFKYNLLLNKILFNSLKKLKIYKFKD